LRRTFAIGSTAMEAHLKLTSVGKGFRGLARSHASEKNLKRHVDKTAPQSTLSG
jgi:hypothetical protein